MLRTKINTLSAPEYCADIKILFFSLEESKHAGSGLVLIFNYRRYTFSLPLIFSVQEWLKKLLSSCFGKKSVNVLWHFFFQICFSIWNACVRIHSFKFVPKAAEHVPTGLL